MVTLNCMRWNTHQFRWRKCYMQAQVTWLHWTVWGATPASSDGENVTCKLRLNGYTELYEVQHRPVQMEKMLRASSGYMLTLNCMRCNTCQFRWRKCNMQAQVIWLHWTVWGETPASSDGEMLHASSGYMVTLNCVRWNTRQFRWRKCYMQAQVIWLHWTVWGATPASLDEQNVTCNLRLHGYTELYEAQHPPVQMDKMLHASSGHVVTLNCMRCNTRQFRWTKCYMQACY